MSNDLTFRKTWISISSENFVKVFLALSVRLLLYVQWHVLAVCCVMALRNAFIK